MKIYTRGGDKGETSLYGGKRVAKDSIRLESYGTVDELNSFVGLARAEINDKEVSDVLKKVQDYLFVVGADLATPASPDFKFRVGGDDVLRLEKWIDQFHAKLPALTQFILPGGNKPAAYLHVSRAVCRRAERFVVTLTSEENLDNDLVMFLNRLSDLFFVLARYVNEEKDEKWEKDQ